MIQIRDVTGRISRLMTIGHIMKFLGFLQVTLSVSGIPIPPQYQWVQGVFLAAVGYLINEFRKTTTTPMAP